MKCGAISCVARETLKVTRDIPECGSKNGIFFIRVRAWEIAGVILLVCGALLCGSQAHAGAKAALNVGTFTTFDPPGSQYTNPTAINSNRSITGYYDAGAAFAPHGFVRAPDGGIITFDPPGSVSTYPTSIDQAGAITGYYCDAVTCHGFLRASDGTFTTFDSPGAVRGTEPFAINSARTVTGFYIDAGSVGHGFLRTRDGKFTTFDPPGSLSTDPTAINPAGAITGSYCDETTCHGFLRASDGAFTPFDPEESTLTIAKGINPKGEIAGYYGYYEDDYADGGEASFEIDGFVRAADGTFTTFDSPGAVKGTEPLAINPAGTITGFYIDASSLGHGFLRTRDGKFATFDPPGSVSTYPAAINRAAEITGTYYDAKGVGHGFLRTSSQPDDSEDSD